MATNYIESKKIGTTHISGFNYMLIDELISFAKLLCLRSRCDSERPKILGIRMQNLNLLISADKHIYLVPESRYVIKIILSLDIILICYGSIFFRSISSSYC